MLANVAAAGSGDANGQTHPVADFENNYYLIGEAHPLRAECLSASAYSAIAEEDILHASGRLLSALWTTNLSALKIQSEGLHGIGRCEAVQGSFRLIRTEMDSGDLWVLDRRLVHARYGSKLLISIPLDAIKREVANGFSLKERHGLVSKAHVGATRYTDDSRK